MDFVLRRHSGQPSGLRLPVPARFVHRVGFVASPSTMGARCQLALHTVFSIGPACSVAPASTWGAAVVTPRLTLRSSGPAASGRPHSSNVRRFGSLMNSRLHLPSSLTAAIAASATGAGTFCTSRQPRRLAAHRGGQVPAPATHSFLYRSGVLRRGSLNMGCCRSYPPSNTALKRQAA